MAIPVIRRMWLLSSKAMCFVIDTVHTRRADGKTYALIQSARAALIARFVVLTFRDK
jgi:hypothetical protein